MKLIMNNITIQSIGNASGYFISEKNTIRKRQYDSKANDIFGTIHGDRNYVDNSFTMLDDDDFIDQTPNIKGNDRT